MIIQDEAVVIGPQYEAEATCVQCLGKSNHGYKGAYSENKLEEGGGEVLKNPIFFFFWGGGLRTPPLPQVINRAKMLKHGHFWEIFQLR